IVRQVGYTQSNISSERGFDVVSMMFCMHYAFESEAKARQMLKNAKAEQAEKNGEEPKAEEEGELEEGEEKEEGEAEPTAEWGNDIYRVRFPGKTPEDGIFRPPFGWKYNFFLHEAVEEVPEYVVPWEAFRALAEDYNLELQYHKTFSDIWKTEKDDPTLGPLSERMGVRHRHSGELLVSPEEMEAASFYVGFCFYKV
ncbi:mRNA cap methyltransferase, partial [Diaporthe sp. PMI_573]